MEGPDSGYVEGYIGSMSEAECVIDQLQLDFKNWNVSTDRSLAEDMSRTLQEEIQVKLGEAGVSYGEKNLGPNEILIWTMSYGLFPITQSSNGLIYAFGVAQVLPESRN